VVVRFDVEALAVTLLGLAGFAFVSWVLYTAAFGDVLQPLFS
jgi:hypothetical protein